MGATDSELAAIRRELAELKAGQVEIAHTLANVKMCINLIADGVRTLLRERDGASG